MRLDEIRSARSACPPKVVVYGGPKVGKSTFAAGAPGCVFLPLEEGLAGIDVPAFPVARTWADVVEAIGELMGPHEFRHLAVDSLDWLEPLIWAEVCRAGGVDSIELVGGGYGKGYIECDKLWRLFLDGMDALRDRGMTPILIAHDQIKDVQPADGDAYQQATLKLHRRAVGIVTEWADVIGYARAKAFVRAVEPTNPKAKKEPRRHALPGGQRTLFIGQHPAYVTGNRFGLPDEINLSWTDFAAALTAARGA